MPQKYTKPPIVEAVLHVRYREPMTAGQVRRISALLKSRYPNSREEADFQMVAEAGGKKVLIPKAVQVDTGNRLVSGNDQLVVVTRPSSVLFAHQAPYPGWEAFIGQAHFVFDTLRDKIGVRTVSSVGLRYVNRIDIPSPEGRINPTDYLSIGVAVPSTGLVESSRLFQVLSEVDLNHDKLVARIGAATAVPALIGYVALLLDIDIIAQADVPAKAVDFWALVARMRDDKNTIFESCVTDKARALFGTLQ